MPITRTTCKGTGKNEKKRLKVEGRNIEYKIYTNEILESDHAAQL